MKRPNLTSLKWMALVMGFCNSAWGLDMLTTDELREETGQALFAMSSYAGNVSENQNVGFQRLTINAELELNINVKKVQLGCGGVNGAGGCDIDIDNLSLSGLNDSSSSARVKSDAVITNPFIEFAVKNPASLASRQIVGFRLGSSALSGLLTTGTNDGTLNGINTLSGYLNVMGAPGTTSTKTTQLQDTISGRVNIANCGFFSCATTTFSTDRKPLTINSIPVSFDIYGAQFNQSRGNSITLPGFANIPTVNLSAASGSRSATLGCLAVVVCGYSINQLWVNASINGLKANLTVNENLGNVHRIPLNNPVSISLQSESVFWPGTPTTAQRGWWLAISDPINLGRFDLASNYQVNMDSILPDVANKVSGYLQANPLNVSLLQAVGSVFGSLTANVGNVDLSYSAPLQLVVPNPVLSTQQNVTSNCYGGLKFC